MYITILFLCFIVLSDQTIVPKTEKRNTDFLNFINTIPQGDLIGGIVNIFHGALSEIYKNTLPSEDNNCIPKLLKLGENDLKVSIRPRGPCSYCCHIHKLSRYIRLYFSNKNITIPVEIKVKNVKNRLRNAGVEANSPTVIFVHGFGEYGLGTSSKYIENAYLSAKKEHNIFLLDWGELSSFPWYPQASAHTKIVAQYVGKFISFYHDTGELPISKIHIVGFSLGAHIAGFIGKYLKERGYEKIPRITALDPALPTFLVGDRISKEDAHFVDVIHTDAGKFGIGFSIGHADFYPNGGSFVQPGCEVSSLINQSHLEQIGYCGHLRAWKLYAESVQNPTAFPAIKVSNMRFKRDKPFQFVAETVMGFSVNEGAKGDYFLLTNGFFPFSKSAKEQEIEMIFKE